jgi:hypothetical protein
MSQREVTCPVCSGSVLVKTSGRVFASITGFLQRKFAIQIPTSVVNYIKEHTPVSKSSIFKGPCPACGGKTKLKDPSDDSAAYEKVKLIAQNYAPEIANEEAKTGTSGAGCGNRYSILQGCDLLEVGLGFNDVPSYRVDIDGKIRNWGITSDISTSGSLAIPKGGKANHVQGINVAPFPNNTGMYTIKCSNKFSVLAGALGVDITTGGPFTVNAGITQIIAPEVTIGCKSGTLLLEGDVVNINGKSVEVTPTDGHFFVKGTMSNTGNLITGGHAHAESISFVNAICTGKNETSKISAPGDLITGPALYGGSSLEAGPAALKDLISKVLQDTSHPTFAAQLASPSFIAGMNEKMYCLTYSMIPLEVLPSGITLTGEPVYLYPHFHSLHDAKHVHETRIPNIDCSADDSKVVRSKVKTGLDSSAPKSYQSRSAITAITELFSTVGSTFTTTAASISNIFVIKSKTTPSA